MAYFIAIGLGYLLGCSNLAYWLAKWNNVDFRKGGSGNLGASNTTILLGWKAGVLVGIHDIGKAVLAVVLAKLLLPGQEHIGAVAGVSAVLGHVFPFYLKFKGGKGLASFFGTVLALNWKIGILIGLLLVIITLVTDFISLGTLTVSVAAPVGFLLITGRVLIPMILAVASMVLIYKHIENIHRLLNRTEIGLRSTIKGENRVK